MTGNRRALAGFLLMTCLVIPSSLCHVAGAVHSQAPTPPLGCTKEALAAIKPTPTIEYDCRQPDEANMKSPLRRAALKDYLRQIESTFADPHWWAAKVDDLNVCSAIGEARELTPEERRDYQSGDRASYLYGDDCSRLLAVTDPCIAYSYGTLNAYILERVGDRVYATQVLDAYFTRLDNALGMKTAGLNGEKVIIVETNTSDGMMPPSPFTTWSAYTISPRTHRAVPKKLFKEGPRLTNQFRYDDYVFDDERLAAKWREPELVRNGKLSSRFTVSVMSKRQMLRQTYVWNGKYYVRGR